MMVDRDTVRLLHIRDAIARIEEYAAVGYERFLSETMTQDAIVWQLRLLNEAARCLSEGLRNKNPEFDSDRMRRLQEEFDRRLLNFDLDLAWELATTTLPELEQTVGALLENAPYFKESEKDPVIVVDPLLIANRAAILRIANENGATRVRIFGSRARGTARSASDVDLLIDLNPGSHLLHLVAIKQDLEALLGREVHVVTEAATSPYIRDEVLRSAAPL